MYELVITELENQIRIVNQKLPSIDESIKTYSQMTKNYQAEKDEMLRKLTEMESAINILKERSKLYGRRDE